MHLPLCSLPQVVHGVAWALALGLSVGVCPALNGRLRPAFSALPPAEVRPPLVSVGACSRAT
eukprot:100298-Rhodomonas_salina.1